MHRLTVIVTLLLFPSTLLAAPPELDWEQANRQRMFVLANNQHRIAAIVVDTTQEEGLRTAIRLQTLVFRLSGARLPIVDEEFQRVPWGNIHLQWDYQPMQIRQQPYTIVLQEDDSSVGNPQKQLNITGAPPARMEQAVSTFTKAAFGMPLSAIDDPDFKWNRVDTLAIPADFAVVAPQQGK